MRKREEETLRKKNISQRVVIFLALFNWEREKEREIDREGERDIRRSWVKKERGRV